MVKARWSVVVLPADGSDRPQILMPAHPALHEPPAVVLGLHLLAQSGMPPGQRHEEENAQDDGRSRLLRRRLLPLTNCPCFLRIGVLTGDLTML